MRCGGNSAPDYVLVGVILLQITCGVVLILLQIMLGASGSSGPGYLFGVELVFLQIMLGTGGSSGPGYLFGVELVFLQIMLGTGGSSGPGYLSVWCGVILLQLMFGVVVVLLEITCLLWW